MMKKLTGSLPFVLLAALLTPHAVMAQPEGQAAASAPADNAATPLYEGPAAEAVQTLQQRDDNSARTRFAKGVAQTLAAFERLTQSANRYGLKSDVMQSIPMMGMAMVSLDNPAEEAIDAEKFRTMLDRFNQDLAQAQQTLEGIEPGEDFKLVVDIAKVRLDYNGDGESGEDEGLARLMQRLQRNMAGRRGAGMDQGQPGPAGQREASFPIAFDAGDLAWLRGYCHLLMGLTDFVLAHNTDEIFNRTGHFFFDRVDTPYAFLANQDREDGMNWIEFADMIAFIHLIRLDVQAPDRLADALEHFKQVSAASRTSWEAILAETDNDREWIPAPDQQSVLGNALTVDQERVDNWMRFLDEYDAIVAGEKLLPFWRGGPDEQRGVNLAKVFEEPKPMDLVLWVQGSAAKPYLEEGEKTTGEFWRQLQRAFRGDFMTFAVIVN